MRSPQPSSPINKVGKIMAAVGASMLAVGFILAFFVGVSNRQLYNILEIGGVAIGLLGIGLSRVKR